LNMHTYIFSKTSIEKKKKKQSCNAKGQTIN
jgi:hypothetical protein